MNLSASRALANALRSILWMVSLHTNMHKDGPTLRDLKIAMGRAIVELEGSHRIKRRLNASRGTARLKPRPELLGFAALCRREIRRGTKAV
jgi:hypothetical protein